MTWSEVMVALLVSHVAGDVMLQTEWQAMNKPRGLHDPLGRRALMHHVASYMLAFVPVLVWIGIEADAGRAVAVAAIVGVLHLAVDDGRIVALWLRTVKGVESPAPALRIAVDQSFHVVCLLAAALVAVL